MINEAILQQEATKKGVGITPADLDQKAKETEAQYGGTAAFDSLLSQQGLTRADFLAQTRIQLMVEKLYSNEASPSSADIDQFMKDNQNNPEASDAAKFRQTATDQIRQQNLSKIFNEKFQVLKQAAKIQIF